MKISRIMFKRAFPDALFFQKDFSDIFVKFYIVEI